MENLAFRMNNDFGTFRRSDIDAIGFADSEVIALYIFKIMHPGEDFAQIADITPSRLWILERRLEDSLKLAEEIRNDK
jgi:hypothetical protein